MKKKFEHKKFENRKARFNYEFVEDFTAGIVLTGCEIKSIRMGCISFNDSYCVVVNGEVFVKNLHISAYDKSGYEKSDPMRDKKLLLTKREIRRLDKKVRENGMTIVPEFLFIDERGIAKMRIHLAKGKHTYDKKQTIKERDLEREVKKF